MRYYSYLLLKNNTRDDDLCIIITIRDIDLSIHYVLWFTITWAIFMRRRRCIVTNTGIKKKTCWAVSEKGWMVCKKKTFRTTGISLNVILALGVHQVSGWLDIWQNNPAFQKPNLLLYRYTVCIWVFLKLRPERYY